MDAMYEWGLQVIRFLQQGMNTPVTVCVKTVTELGGPVAYIVFLSVLLWCVDGKKGFKIGLAALFSCALNAGLKATLCVDRPYVNNPEVGIVTEHGFSTPSAHAQLSATVAPYAVSLFRPKRRLGLCISVFFPLLIALSRVCLGVHYPSDVLIGLCFGYLISAGCMLYGKKLEALITPLRKSVKMLIAAVVSFAFITWNDTCIPYAAALFGLSCGMLLTAGNIPFNAKSGSKLQKVIRLVIGYAFIVALYMVLHLAEQAVGSRYAELAQFMVFGIIGCAVTGFVPRLFSALKLV